MLEAEDLVSAQRQIAQAPPALMIVGGSAGGSAQSLEYAARLRGSHPGIPLLFFASKSTEDLAIAALKVGMGDYIRQPGFEELAGAIDQWVCKDRESAAAQEPLRGPLIAGRSVAVARTRQCLVKLAAANCNVLITGETGTGKELVAEAIHQNSPRSHKPFVTINCAAIPDSLLESELFGYERGAFTGARAASFGKLMQADGGTVFFDEVGEMDLCAQAKILRAIENKEVQRIGAKQNPAVDIRIVAATNQDLEQLALMNRFRRDLYFRLSVTQIRLPALRDRPEDIPVLVDFFVRELNERMGRRIHGLRPS